MQFNQVIPMWWKRYMSAPWNAGQAHFLLAVSGGVDSVVLTDLVAQSGIPFTIAHCNFQLRGEESTRDENFVRSLGEKYKTAVRVQTFDTASIVASQKRSVQEVARQLRYNWFDEVRMSLIEKYPGKLVVLLTAHHAGDNIETMLMHLFRGTGLHGLTGMEAYRPEIQLGRPLLQLSRQQLQQYAEEKGLSYVEDSSNASNDYTRNYFRNQLIPAIKNVFPEVETTLLQTMGRLQEAEMIYQERIRQTIATLLVTRVGEEFHIPVAIWKQATPLMTVTFELLKPFQFTAAQTAEAVKLLDAVNSGYMASSTHRLIRNRNWMIIAPVQSTQEPSMILIDADTPSVTYTHGSLTLASIESDIIPQDTNQALIDVADLAYPLHLRPWKQGDYFYPLGMPKKKKISRFLTDIKLSKTEKEKVWVLESDKKIIWVIGWRIDHRFRITQATQSKMLITYRR